MTGLGRRVSRCERRLVGELLRMHLVQLGKRSGSLGSVLLEDKVLLLQSRQLLRALQVTGLLVCLDVVM